MKTREEVRALFERILEDALDGNAMWEVNEENEMKYDEGDIVYRANVAAEQIGEILTDFLAND